MVMNVLLETGMDPQQIDPAAVHQALCRTKGDMDAALDIILADSSVLDAILEVTPTHDLQPCNGANDKGRVGAARRSLVAADAEDERALELALSASAAMAEEEEALSRRQVSTMRDFESQVQELSAEQARMDAERRRFDELQLEMAMLLSQLEESAGNSAEEELLRHQLRSVQGQHSQMQAKLNPELSPFSDVDTNSNAAPPPDEQAQAEVQGLKQQIEQLMTAQQEERQMYEAQLRTQANQITEASAQRQAELEASSNAPPHTQSMEYVQMCAELERHKLVSAELASHRQQYEAVRAELDMRIATEARHVSSSEAKIAALRADCERLHQQLEHERAAAALAAEAPPGSSLPDIHAADKTEKEITDMTGQLKQEQDKLLQVQSAQAELVESLKRAHAEEMQRLQESLDSESTNRKAVRKKAKDLAHELESRKAQNASQEEKMKKLQMQAKAALAEKLAAQSQAVRLNSERDQLKDDVQRANDENARLRAQLEAATAAQQGSTSGVTTNRPRVSAFAAFPAPEAEDFEGSVVEPSRPKKSQMHVPHTPTTAAYHLPTKFDPCIPGGF